MQPGIVWNVNLKMLEKIRTTFQDILNYVSYSLLYFILQVLTWTQYSSVIVTAKVRYDKVKIKICGNTALYDRATVSFSVLNQTIKCTIHRYGKSWWAGGEFEANIVEINSDQFIIKDSS